MTMQTIYIRVRLKPIVKTVPKPRKLPKGQLPPKIPDAPIPEPVFEVRRVQAEDIAHACRKGEEMLDVLAVLETSVEPIV